MLAEREGVVHISTGVLLRRAIREETRLGTEARQYVESGKLVPGSLVRSLADEALRATSYDNFVLDGYPRTIQQADWLMADLGQKNAPLDAVVSLVVSDEVIVDRLSKRRVNVETGENYHLDFKPVPEGVDPSKIIQRKDDRPEAILHRLEIYRQETFPVEDYFRKLGLLVEVSGEGSFGDVYNSILAAVTRSA